MQRDSSSKPAPIAVAVAVDEIPEELDVEKLGRKRPDVFSSAWTEAVFVGSMLMCLSMAVCTQQYPSVSARLVTDGVQ